MNKQQYKYVDTPRNHVFCVNYLIENNVLSVVQTRTQCLVADEDETRQFYGGTSGSYSYIMWTLHLQQW